MRLTMAGFILGSFAGFTVYAQSVVSVHSGVVHYTQGDVFIQDKAVDMKFGHFPEIKPNESLRTEEGRAEILLTPGSFLRVAENSSIRMISNSLADTRFELLKGEALVESVDWTKDSAAAKIKGNLISVLCKDSTTILEKPGLYQFNAEPGRLRVFEGEALIKNASGQLTLKRGKETQLEGALMAEKFDSKVGDELSRWSEQRSGYLATANVSAARSLNSNYGSWSSYAGGAMGGWAFDPTFGMYTFVPMGGIAFSPFGYGYFSPYTVGQYFPYYGGYGGYGGYYYPGGGSSSGGGGNTATAYNPGGRSGGRPTGNFGGNSAARPAAASFRGHGGAPGFNTGSGSQGAASYSSARGISSASSGGISGYSGGGGGRSGGGGMGSSGGGGHAGGGGASSGGGRAR